jgi:hypothetical protein
MKTKLILKKIKEHMNKEHNKTFPKRYNTWCYRYALIFDTALLDFLLHLTVLKR